MNVKTSEPWQGEKPFRYMRRGSLFILEAISRCNGVEHVTYEVWRQNLALLPYRGGKRLHSVASLDEAEKIAAL